MPHADVAPESVLQEEQERQARRCGVERTARRAALRRDHAARRVSKATRPLRVLRAVRATRCRGGHDNCGERMLGQAGEGEEHRAEGQGALHPLRLAAQRAAVRRRSTTDSASISAH